MLPEEISLRLHLKAYPGDRKREFDPEHIEARRKWLVTKDDLEAKLRWRIRYEAGELE